MSEYALFIVWIAWKAFFMGIGVILLGIYLLYESYYYFRNPKKVPDLNQGVKYVNIPLGLLAIIAGITIIFRGMD